MPLSWHKIGRILVVVGVVMFFAASTVSAELIRDSDRQSSAVVTIIKVPVMVLTKAAVRQAKLEREISNKILHAGVDLFTRSIRWLSRKEESKQKSAPEFDFRNW